MASWFENTDVISNLIDLGAFLLITPEINARIRRPIRSWSIVVELFIGVAVAAIIMFIWAPPILKHFGIYPFLSIGIMIMAYGLTVYGFMYWTESHRDAVEKLPTIISRGLFTIGVSMFLLARIVNVFHALNL